MANKQHYPEHFDPLDHIMNTQGLSPYDARNQLEAADDDDSFQHETEPHVPQSSLPLGARAVEISTYVIPPEKGTKEVTSPAGWKPASQYAARGPQYGDSEFEAGRPTYLQPYDKDELDALTPGIQRGRETVQPVLDEVAQRIKEKKLRRARGL